MDTKTVEKPQNAPKPFNRIIITGVFLIVVCVVLYNAKFTIVHNPSENQDCLNIGKDEKDFETWLLHKETYKKYQGLKEARSAYELKKFLEKRNLPSHVK